MLELSPSGKANFIAVVAMIGILGALLLVLRASSNESAIYGPGPVTATAGGKVYFVADGTLFSTAAAGALQERVPLKALGHANLRLYDGSWTEWSAEPSLPVQVG